MLNLKFCVILMTKNVNAVSHLWLAAPAAWAGPAEGMAGQIVLFLVLDPP